MNNYKKSQYTCIPQKRLSRSMPHSFTYPLSITRVTISNNIFQISINSIKSHRCVTGTKIYGYVAVFVVRSVYFFMAFIPGCEWMFHLWELYVKVSIFGLLICSTRFGVEEKILNCCVKVLRLFVTYFLSKEK